MPLASTTELNTAEFLENDKMSTEELGNVPVRRSRRSTAGNRMADALAEMVLDDSLRDAEDDVDFVNDNDEQDDFDGDFASTDEENNAEDTMAGETEVAEEDKRTKKAAREKVKKATAAAHTRQKVSFNPETKSAASEPNVRVTRRGTIRLDNDKDGSASVSASAGRNKQRSSRRTATVQNTSATFTRMQQEAQKTARKRVRVETKTMTQAELIAQALDNEEGNIVSHRDYLIIEEEKRSRARVVRAGISGPLVRWTSRAEKIQVEVLPPRPIVTPTKFRYTPHPTMSPKAPSSFSFVPQIPAYDIANPSSLSVLTSAPLPVYPPKHTGRITRTETVAKNYLVHELFQFAEDQVISDPDLVTAAKPSWHETMGALFGTEVDWENVRVFSGGEAAPTSRQKYKCPITGLPAIYKDPRTGVPFANARAYKVLTRVLNHEFMWHEEMGGYLGSLRPPSGARPEEERESE